VDVNNDVIEDLLSQLQWKLNEGNGETLYDIGANEDGSLGGLNDEELNVSMENLIMLAKKLHCECSLVCIRPGDEGNVALMLVRENKKGRYLDIRISVCGNVDSGKSTLVGVLTSSKLDNGRGLSRVFCFKHQHEINTGRTSSIGNQIMGFSCNGECVNDVVNLNQHKSNWEDIIDKSFKLITFLDLAGHEKYIKTTVSGITGHMPDYCMLLIGANMGVTKMTREHLKLALSFKIPVIIVITKIDIAPTHILKKTVNDIKSLLKAGNRKTFTIQSENDVINCVKNLHSDVIYPIFKISNVTGENLNFLKIFLNILTPRIQWNLMIDKPTEVTVDEIYTITGVGTVIGGIVLSGIVKTGQDMLLGPTEQGEFMKVKIKSIQTNRVPVKQVQPGRSAGFALKNIRRSLVRKGMILTSIDSNPRSAWLFEALIIVLQHSTTVKKNYEPMIQCMNIRQSAKILSIYGENHVLRSGDKGNVLMEFKYRPEYLKEGIRFILRDGGCKAIGVISKILYDGIQSNEDTVD